VWFVTPVKEQHEVPPYQEERGKTGGSAVSDYQILIPSRSRETVFRKVIVRDKETGKKIVLLTNNLKWSAETLGAIYRKRRQLALFFKEIKQKLKIQRF
jgi:IS4 transposase